MHTQELCESLDIKILAYSPFAQGVLTGKYDNVEIPEGSRGKNQRKMQSQTVDLRRVLREIADAYVHEMETCTNDLPPP